MAIPIEKWKVLLTLTSELEKKEDALSIAQDQDNPNDERIDKLENQCNLLEEMTNLLEEYGNL